MPALARSALLAIGAAAAAAGCSGVSCRRTPVVVNTDPGVDDAMALLLLARSPAVDLRGLAINFGNSPNVTLLTHNALAILQLAGRTDVPVAAGAWLPVSAPWEDLGALAFHGANAVGGATLPQPTRKPDPRSAAQLIVDVCRKGAAAGRPATILSLAPLSNLAVALELEPALPELCPQLVMMGGSVTAAGNVSPLAEANFANDPEAARRVFAAGFNISLAPLDVTMQTLMTPAYLDSIRGIGNECAGFVWRALQMYAAAYRDTGYPSVPVHDSSGVALLTHPQLYGMRHWAVTTVATPRYPNPVRGFLVVDRRGGPLTPPPPANATTSFAMRVNVTGFLRWVHSTLAALP
eukprot:TRINITY_DN70255_c0_g1_i1.p1 TRINITY_DN70255_c0_g1~~TRINITY_DN70255_c0_g1_i1.p1  ORF type:complete len:380 (+),score=99.26 TRINITY_DN70255_c0_g1_i1:88-1140(+)